MRGTEEVRAFLLEGVCRSERGTLGEPVPGGVKMPAVTSEIRF
jgi:hypothetical protein